MPGKLFRDAWVSLRADWRLKLVLTVAANVVFWSGYWFLGNHVFFPLRLPPLTWLDTAIPFQPGWGWIYLSQFSFTGLLPWFLSQREHLWRYVAGFLLLSWVSFAFFLFFPVASPRPELAATMDGAMALILGYDGRYNAFPSLHAGFLSYMAALAWRMSRGALPRWVVAGGCLWGGAILYATLATRQHYACDLVAGLLVGAVADWFAWRLPVRKGGHEK